MPFRKFGLLASAILLGVLFPTLGVAARARAGQAAEPGDIGSFEPLARWKAAVLAGDRKSIASFYASTPGASLQTPEGESDKPAEEETEFWAKQAAAGLTAMEPKILERISPQPYVIHLTLRAELTFHSGSETRQSVVSVTQIWVERGGDWRILSTQRGAVKLRPAIALPEPKIPDPNLYPPPGEASKDVEAALASAGQDRKRVLVVFGANWCYDCQVLGSTLQSKDVAPLVEANYHVVKVNIGEGHENEDLAARFQVPISKGIPSLAVLDSDGRLITSQKHGEFESAAKIGLGDVTQFLEQWKPAAGK